MNNYVDSAVLSTYDTQIKAYINAVASTPVVPTYSFTLNISMNDNDSSALALASCTVSVNGTPAQDALTTSNTTIDGLNNGDVLTFSMSNVTGYATPTVSSVTIDGGNVSANAVYNTEVLSVIVKDDSDNAMNTPTITVSNGNTTLGTLTNGGTLKIPFGINYTCTPSLFSGYTEPTAVTKDWSDTASKSLTFVYEEIQNVVDMGVDNIIWATGNIVKNGDTYSIGSETDAGAYFSWGDIIGHSSSEGYDFSSSNYSNGVSGSGHNLTQDFSSGSTTYDAARVRLGSPWRMPTKANFDNLIAACDSTWESNYNNSGVAGRLLTLKTDSSKKIFFPAVGYYNGSTLSYSGTDGYSWSATYYDSSYAYYLYFSSSNVSTSYYNRYGGMPIRPIKDK